MAANALDTLRLIGKTLVVEYNAKTPSRLKVSEREKEREEEREARSESEGESEIDGSPVECSRTLLRLLLKRQGPLRS